MITIEEAQRDSVLYDKFIEENLRFVHFIVRKFDSGMEYEDYIQIGSIGLIKAVKTFKAERDVKFATYAAPIITNEILMYLRKKKKHDKNISLDAPLSEDVDGNELTLMDISDSGQNIEDGLLNKVELIEKTSELLSKLSGKYRQVFMAYINNEIQDITAEKLGLSQSYISRMLKKIQSLGTKIDSNYQSGRNLGLRKLGESERKIMEEIKFSRSVAEKLLKEGKLPDKIAEEFKGQFSGQPRVVKAMMAKWGLVEKKVKPEREARVEGTKKRTKKLTENEPTVNETLLTAEVMAGKEFKYELGNVLTIKKGEDKLPCTYEGLPRLIKELQEVQRMKQEAV